MPPPTGSLLWRSLRAYQIYGANTDVGKTIFSTLLCKASAERGLNERVSFVKPVSTGPLDEADDGHVSHHAKGVNTKCLFQFENPVSPHIAAALSKKETPTDESILSKIRNYLAERAHEADHPDTKPAWALVETAGGVHSPGPSGKSQADLYRPLRLPVILVADSRLGGISSTISAYESLLIRGYDVEAVMMFRDEVYRNHGYLMSYFSKQTSFLAIPAPPERVEDRTEDMERMGEYYSSLSQREDVQGLLATLATNHETRQKDLETMAERAHQKIWYPFTQQKLLDPSGITTIDSASGDFFQTYVPGSTSNSMTKSESTSPSGNAVTQPSFDGSASWWTQGLGHANPELTLAAAYAAGRYGHVMFAEAIHEPALNLAELLLKTVGHDRLTRVFYSDNGSTGTEVALKMGLRAARVRYGWKTSQQIGVIGLKGSYHGDTIGAMDSAEPCTYNEKVEWYSGKGYWFDYPVVKMKKGQWIVEVPESLQSELGPSMAFSSLSEVFDVMKREEKGTARRYKQYINNTLAELQARGKKFGALIIEPVILGAGGMLFVDPLFQRTLVHTVRTSPHLFTSPPFPSPPSPTSPSWTGLPVIFDEVFTGLYRLGRPTSASFLQLTPDISVHAKLLTGGLLPLCTTLASESVFEAFASEDKSDALLHGHSYTAHAVGCKVAETSIKTMTEMDESGSWEAFKRAWAAVNATTPPAPTIPTTPTAPAVPDPATPHNSTPEVWSTWSPGFLTALSHCPRVDSCFALGSVLAITIVDGTGGAGGYKSTAAKDVQACLRRGEESEGWNVHSRVLGNVLYLMTGQGTGMQTVRALEALVGRALGVEV
ncbi:onanonoxo-7-onima-8-eninoihtemlysoneda [Saccharata proteae CBS 121410]|uniref:Onanonoxo-7-onima-8-eninoihtemlysoneda n=1 Tax=Saccharata proteae CBS 121410 TaxID=1314787 RepID=A0A9P4LVJ0_9PEZI|nr:onanonoxo-7-onima-8-eninoihtemlysoneda [Saccharata proteae CBS 121410]